jgi:hypothetical protein
MRRLICAMPCLLVCLSVPSCASTGGSEGAGGGANVDASQAEWACGTGYEYCECYFGLGTPLNAVDVCEGYQCCMDGTEIDGKTKSCLCYTQTFVAERGWTCDQMIAESTNERRRVPSCPAE